MGENWKPVCGYVGAYEVSDEGRVRSLDRTVETSQGKKTYQGKLLKGWQSGEHLAVELSRKRRYVHHLVAEAFLGPRPEGMFVCHRDDVKHNNRADNLYYGSQRENGKDVVRNGNHPNRNKTHCSKGHPFDEDNTAYMPSGRRRCRACGGRKKRAFPERSTRERRVTGAG